MGDSNDEHKRIPAYKSKNIQMRDHIIAMATGSERITMQEDPGRCVGPTNTEELIEDSTREARREPEERIEEMDAGSLAAIGTQDPEATETEVTTLPSVAELVRITQDTLNEMAVQRLADISAQDPEAAERKRTTIQTAVRNVTPNQIYPPMAIPAYNWGLGDKIVRRAGSNLLFERQHIHVSGPRRDEKSNRRDFDASILALLGRVPSGPTTIRRQSKSPDDIITVNIDEDESAEEGAVSVCVACVSNIPKLVNMPCGHACFCNSCWIVFWAPERMSQRNCPICRKTVLSGSKVDNKDTKPPEEEPSDCSNVT